MQSYKKTLTFLAAVLIAGCQKPLFPGGPRYLREPERSFRGARGSGGAGRIRDTVQGPVEKPAKRIYITAINGGDAVLLADGEELSRAPAESDPERHRARDGHLWTDAIEGKETVVFRDGKEWLRFSGEELLRGFHLSGGKLHTLGQRPGNGGVCYRVDGKEVFSAPAGRVIGSASAREWDSGAFSADSSGLFYTYGIPFVHSGHTSWEYRVMKGPALFLTIPDDVSGVVLDIRVYKGKVYRVDMRTNAIRLLCGDDVLRTRKLNQGETVSDIALVPHNGEMCVRGQSYISRTNYTIAWFWEKEILDRYTETQGAATPFLFKKGNLRVFGLTAAKKLISLNIDGKVPPIDPDKYYFSNNLCLNVFDTTFTAILTDSTGTTHLLLTDTLATPLRFAGVPTSIRIE